MVEFKVGKVTHYYDKIGVAVVELTAEIVVGDKIKFVWDGEEVLQSVESMQMEHKQVDVAKKGETVGLKVDQPVKPGAEILKQA